MASHTEMVNQWLAELNLGPNASFDEMGLLEFTDENGKTVRLELVDDDLIFYSELLPLPAEPRQRLELMRKALEMNRFCLETKGCTVSLSADDAGLALCYRAAVAFIGPGAFSPLFGNFLTAADTVRETLSAAIRADTDDDIEAETNPLPVSPEKKESAPGWFGGFA